MCTCVYVQARTYRPVDELRVDAEGDREKIHLTGSPKISTANLLSPNSVNLPLILFKLKTIMRKDALEGYNRSREDNSREEKLKK